MHRIGVSNATTPVFVKAQDVPLNPPVSFACGFIQSVGSKLSICGDEIDGIVVVIPCVFESWKRKSLKEGIRRMKWKVYWVDMYDAVRYGVGELENWILVVDMGWGGSRVLWKGGMELVGRGIGEIGERELKGIVATRNDDRRLDCVFGEDGMYDEY